MKKYITHVLIVSLFFTVFGLYSPELIPQAQASINDWQKGASVVPMSTTDLSSESFRQSMRNLQSVGANTVTLIVPYYQSNQWSTDLNSGWNTPTDQSLTSAIDYVHSLGMKVVLKMHAESNDGAWRAYINPGDRDTWFRNYGNILNHLADIGKAHNVEGMVVGAEMISMATYTSNGDNTQRWNKMISDVRSRFSGFLTYSANWGAGDFAEEASRIGFWGSLDYIGISAYYPFNGDASVQNVMSQWDNWRTQKVEPLKNQYNKPVIFTEIGYRSLAGAQNQPWESGGGGSYSAETQSNLYEAFFKYWNNYSYFSGLYFWHWSTDPNAGGAGNQYYYIQNKPAQNTFKQYFAGGITPTPSPTVSPSPSPTISPTPSPTTSPSPSPSPVGAWSANASVSNPQINTELNGSVQVKNNGNANDVIVDIEIYDANNNKKYQTFSEHQNINQAQPGQYLFKWTPTQNGNYTIKVGTFSSNWSQNYYWNNEVLTFTVGGTVQPSPSPSVSPTPSPTVSPTPSPSPSPSPSPTPTPTNYSTNIWWPSNGAEVHGVQPFKAMLEGNSIENYRMYWQVDGGQLNEMANSTQDYPHKEVWVDVSSWNWKGRGPYTINFVSKDNSGSTISQKSTDIFTSN